MNGYYSETILDKIVKNFKLAFKAKQRALKYGKYKDIKEFRERIEYNDTLIGELQTETNVGEIKGS